MAAPAVDSLAYGVIARYQDVSNFYYAVLQPVGADIPGVSLYERVAGVETQLGSTIGAAEIAMDAWYRLFLLALDSSLRVRVQRVSDSKWLTAAGAWQTNVANCITVAESSLTGSSKAGLYALHGGSMSNGMYSDNFLFEIEQDFPVLDTVQLPTSFTCPPAVVAYGQGL